jgi:hypothetical protein
MAKFNGKNVTVKESGTKYSENFNGEGEGGGYRKKYSAYDENDNRIGAVVPNGNGYGKVFQDGKCTGTVKMDESGE